MHSSDLLVWTPWQGPETTMSSSQAGYVDVRVEIPHDANAAFFRATADSR